MKVKVLSRNPDDYLRETKRDIYAVPRNYDPALHPFEQCREYVRALNAVKLDKVFAKPFVGNLDGHRDGISILAKHPKSLSIVASGAFDGEVRLWNLPLKKCLRTVKAHNGNVRGISFVPSGERFVTTGDDKAIKIWSTEPPNLGEDEIPVFTMISKTLTTGLSYSNSRNQFATCGEVCQLWEETRSEPVRTFQWGVDTVHHIAFNPTEAYLLAACSSDRAITFFDTRETGAIRKLVLALRSNQLAWNPMEPFIYTVANEDYNLYTFDTRRLSAAVSIHKGHIGAVITVDYAPTGLELVSGSYDRTLRIFEVNKMNSREVYHTKRMQRITNVAWTLDNKYVLSSSDEMNIRIWKARASEKLGVLTPREKSTKNYHDSLKQKFIAFPQVKRIARHRHVPKYIYKASHQVRAMRDKEKRKEANRRLHSKPGSVPFISDAKRPIVEEKN